MALYEPFKFSALDELKRKAESLGLEIDFSDNLPILSQEVPIGARKSPNRFSTLPMEGRDSNPDGSPSELTPPFRRYGSGGGV